MNFLKLSFVVGCVCCALLISLSGCKTLPRNDPCITFEIQEYENSSHYIVHTTSATYYYDIQGGGFSRIIDTDGNDWVSFKREPWGEYPASAASSYRGLPNLVFQGDDDGAGHPGHKKCTSRVQGNTIITESLSGKWQWRWEFFDDYAVLDISKTDTSRNFWFLYEGTPGGEFAPERSYFGSDKGGPVTDSYDYYKGDLYINQVKWMYAGHRGSNCVFYMIQQQPDQLDDFMSFLGNSTDGITSSDGMTVFAFGRSRDTKPLLHGTQKFIIGFYPEIIQNASQQDEFTVFADSIGAAVFND